jgi:hypothetical protein
MGWVLATSGSPIVRQRDGRRRGRAGLKPGLYGAGRRRRGLFGEGRLGFARGKPFEALGKREAVVVVRVDGIADGFALGVGAEGLAILVLGGVDSLHESLRQVSDGVSGFGLYIAADDGRDEA